MIDIEIQKILDEKQKKVKNVINYKQLIKEYDREIGILVSQISNLDEKLMSIMRSKKVIKNRKYANQNHRGIPKKGAILKIIEVMDKSNPLTIPEIAQKLEKNKIHLNKHTLRCYLTNFDCFKNYRINDFLQ